MNNAITSPEEVCRNVAIYLRSKGITHEEIGKSLGTSRAYISNILSSKKRFSKQMATMFSRMYGFNRNYLLYGEGEMMQETVVRDIATVPINIQGTDRDTFVILASLVNCAEGILWIMNDKDALSAWHGLTNGDYQEYLASIEKLSARHNNRRSNPILAKLVCEQVNVDWSSYQVKSCHSTKPRQAPKR